MSLYTYLPTKMEQTKCPETSAYKIQMPGNYPEENIQHTEHGESFEIKNISMFKTREAFSVNLAHSTKN